MTQQMEKDIQRLLHLPWTVVREETREGEILLRVKEIPSAVGSGESDEERIADLWESLSESLLALLHFGDPIPLPAGVGQQWTHIAPSTAKKAEFFFVSAQRTSTGAAGPLVT